VDGGEVDGGPADGGEVHARAREVAALADEVRAVVAWARRAAGVDWESAAAEAFRTRLHAETERVLAAAREVDEAASALLAHARALDALSPSRAGAVVAGIVRRLLP
jgi:hypothetical protein